MKGATSVVAIKIDPELLAELDKYAQKQNLSRSEVIRRALERFVTEEIGKEPLPKARIEKLPVKFK